MPARADTDASAAGARCVVCGSACEPLYASLDDHYFGSGVRVGYVVCRDRGCRTIAQHPAPSQDLLARAYSTYYTHRPLGLLQRLSKRASAWLLGRRVAPVRLQACAPASMAQLRAPGVLLDVGGVLPGGPAPSVLDVGCGNGESLLMLSQLGFARACGVETDPRAAAAARALGFEVRVGSAERNPYEDGSFDVVLLRHVIEHAVDPARAIAECLRVLRPGGWLSLITPNAVSTMHVRFGELWRGLESPRHIHIFTTASLAALVRRCGGEVVRVGTSDRSAQWMRNACEQRMRALGRAPDAVPRVLADAPAELERGEEIFVLARRT